MFMGEGSGTAEPRSNEGELGASSAATNEGVSASDNEEDPDDDEDEDEDEEEREPVPVSCSMPLKLGGSLLRRALRGLRMTLLVAHVVVAAPEAEAADAEAKPVAEPEPVAVAEPGPPSPHEGGERPMLMASVNVRRDFVCISDIA